LTLLAISFAYGIFHAAVRPWQGGDLVLSGREQESARGGIVLSFASR